MHMKDGRVVDARQACNDLLVNVFDKAHWRTVLLTTKDKQKALDMALRSHFGTGTLASLLHWTGYRVIPGPDHAPDQVVGSPG